MGYESQYAAQEPSRAELDALPGPTLVEFGAPWCGYCQAAQRDIAAALAQAPGLRHLKVEDGRGRPLGRSFAVKLWPTLVLVEGGEEIGRRVRPHDRREIEELVAPRAT